MNPTSVTSCLYSLLSQSWIINLKRLLLPKFDPVGLETFHQGEEASVFLSPPQQQLELSRHLTNLVKSRLSNKVSVTYDQVELAPQRSRLVDVTPEKTFWTFWTFVSHQRHHFKIYFPPIFFSGSLMWLARHVPFNQVDGDPIPPRQHGKSLLHLFGQSYQSEWFLK